MKLMTKFKITLTIIFISLFFACFMVGCQEENKLSSSETKIDDTTVVEGSGNIYSPSLENTVTQWNTLTADIQAVIDTEPSDSSLSGSFEEFENWLKGMDCSLLVAQPYQKNDMPFSFVMKDNSLVIASKSEDNIITHMSYILNNGMLGSIISSPNNSESSAAIDDILIETMIPTNRAQIDLTCLNLTKDDFTKESSDGYYELKTDAIIRIVKEVFSILGEADDDIEKNINTLAKKGLSVKIKSETENSINIKVNIPDSKGDISSFELTSLKENDTISIKIKQDENEVLNLSWSLEKNNLNFLDAWFKIDTIEFSLKLDKTKFECVLNISNDASTISANLNMQYTSENKIDIILEIKESESGTSIELTGSIDTIDEDIIFTADLKMIIDEDNLTGKLNLNTANLRKAKEKVFECDFTLTEKDQPPITMKITLTTVSSDDTKSVWQLVALEENTKELEATLQSPAAFSTDYSASEKLLIDKFYSYTNNIDAVMEKAQSITDSVINRINKDGKFPDPNIRIYDGEFDIDYFTEINSEGNTFTVSTYPVFDYNDKTRFFYTPYKIMGNTVMSIKPSASEIFKSEMKYKYSLEREDYNINDIHKSVIYYYYLEDQGVYLYYRAFNGSWNYGYELPSSKFVHEIHLNGDEFLNHNFGDTIYDADCYATRTCQDCNTDYKSKIPQHDLSAPLVISDSANYYFCKRCQQAVLSVDSNNGVLFDIYMEPLKESHILELKQFADDAIGDKNIQSLDFSTYDAEHSFVIKKIIGTRYGQSMVGNIDLIIPDIKSITGYQIVGITGGFEANNNINYVVTTFSLPEGLRFVGVDAFRYGYIPRPVISDLELPNSLEVIGHGAFTEIIFNGDTLTLPKNLKFIYNRLFYKSEKLKTLIVDSDHLYYLGGFSGSTALTDVQFNGTVDIIGVGAFAECTALVNITIPESVTILSDRCFYNCSALESINFPKNLKEINMEAFYDCKALNIPEIISIEKIGYSAFKGCKAIKNLKFTNPNTVFETYCFMFCYGLQKVEFVDGFTEIPSFMFSHCTSLKEVILPSTLITIKNNAFNNCSSLSTIQFPDSLENINNRAFSDCTSLLVDISKSNIKRIEEYAFSKCKLPETAYFPESIIYMGDYAFDGCTGAKNLIFDCRAVTINTGIVSQLEVIVYPKTLSGIPNLYAKEIYIRSRFKSRSSTIRSIKAEIETVYFIGTAEEWKDCKLSFLSTTKIVFETDYIPSNEITNTQP